MAADSCGAQRQQQRQALESHERRGLPGNDASWFQALIGDQEELAGGAGVAIDEADSQPTTNDAALLATPGSQPDGADTSVGPPGATATLPDSTAPEPRDPDADTTTPHVVAAPSDEPDPSNSTESVGKTWTPQDSDTGLEVWAPDEMDKTISSSRNIRWTSIIAVLVVIGLVATGLVLLPSVARSRADNRLDVYADALSELRAELRDTQISLETATNPSTGVEALDSLGTQLTVLAAKASTLDETAQMDLPAVPPLTSSEPIDALEPIRQRIEPLGTVAATIQRRIANLAHYRILLSGFLTLPELPTSADSATQAELRVRLAEAQAESASILSELPSDVSLDAHHAQAREVNDRFAGWQVEYLDALRTGDPAAASGLIEELDGLLTHLENELVTPLAQIREQTDTDVIDLARSIEEVMSLIDGDTQPA